MASMMSMSMPMDHTTAATPANKPLPTGGSDASAASAACNPGNIGGSIGGGGVLGGGIGSGIGIGGGPGIGGGIGSGISSGGGIIGVGGGSNSSFHGGGGFPSAAAGDGSGGQQPPPALPGQAKRAEIYTYDAPWPIYGMNWSVRRDKRFRLAVGSFIEDYRNRVEIVQLDDHTGEFRSGPRFSFDHPFPCTKIMFVPDREGTRPDLIATSGDYLRIWQIYHEAHGGVRMRTILNNNRNSEFCAPLTSFDWNESEPRRLGTSSIDTTCTIWDIEREIVDTQLIAHDKEVYDIAWGGIGVFASVSADGSVRVFDLRDKEHSTIIYESPQPETPLLRLAWNRQDPRYMATILMDSAKVVVLDIRFPTLPVAELQRHHASVNAIAWAPHSSCHICTAGDDAQALIWDLSSMAQPAEGGIDPILAYTAGAEINSLQWSASQPEWVAIAFANRMQILRV